MKGKSIPISAVLLALLMFPALPIGSDVSAAPTDPDLAVLDIWTTKGTEINCRVKNIGGPFSGFFGVNLTIDGKYMETEVVGITWPDTMVNVTFTNLLPHGWVKVALKVNIYDPQHGIPDQNRTNDERTERWERDLPNLVPISIFSDPATGTARIMLGNYGVRPTSYGFDTVLYVNGSDVDTVHWKPPIPADGTVTLNTTWKWDRAVSPVNLKVTADEGNVVEESDETDNSLVITWQNRPRPAFTKPPTVQYTGKDNATIVWETSVPTDFVVDYGRSSKLSLTTMSRALSKKGSAELTGLKSSNQYLFKVICTDQYGKRIESAVGSLLTKDPTSTGSPMGSFIADMLRNVSGKVSIPFIGSDPTGIRKVDYYLGGKLIGSKGGSGKDETSGIMFDFSKVKAGNYTMVAVVTNLAGGTNRYSTTCSVGNTLWDRYPKVTFTVTDRTMRGTESFYARCEDPLGIANATWLVDDVVVEFDVPWHPEASYYGATIWWDSTSVSDGEHTIRVKVFNNEGNLTTRSHVITVDNILDPPDPDIWIRRLNIEREGTILTVPLEVSNHGRGTARNIRIVDNIKGFVPIDGEDGTHAVFGEGTRWEVVQEIDHLDPDDVIQIRYRCIPILYHTDEWYIGYELPDPDRPGIDYTTSYSYERDDGLVTYTERTWIPTANFEEGYIMQAGALHTISLSNYIMLTNPQKLLSNMAFGDGYFDFFSEVGLLLEKKNGVFGFIRNAGGSSPDATDIRSTIDGWADLLHPDFRDEGYLAILGEDEIIPVWTYSNVEGSDQGYTNLDGGSDPKLIVGRFLGRTPNDLLVPVMSSLEEDRGNKISDPEGTGLMLAGGGDGVLAFHDSALNIHDTVDPYMDSTLFFHKSQYLPRYTSSVSSDGKSRHVTAGDLDGDGDNEIVTLDPESDLVRILHPGTSSVTQFSVTSEENDLIVYYKDPMGTYIGHIYEGETCGEMALYTLSGDLDFTYNTIEGWQYGDGILVFDEDLDGYDDLFIASAGSDTISDWNDPVSYPVADIRPDSRMARADMDDDGDQDIVIADHQAGCLRIFFWPPPASGTWEEEAISVGGLDYEDGFGAGNYLPSDRNNRGEAVVLQHDVEGYIQVCWWEHEDDGDWVGKSEKGLLTDVGSSCGLVVAPGPSGFEYDEMLVSEGSDRAYVFDYGHCGARFQSAVHPQMVGKDLIVYRDHGNERAWSGLANSDHLDAIDMGSNRHIPVMIGLVCLSGRFHDQTDSFAQSAMLNGAGIYIGATMVSTRDPNNRAIAMIEDYVSGTPIGKALRDYEAEYSVADTSAGLKWSRMYNLYGDPAFGTDGSPLGSGSRGPPSRAGPVDVTVPEPEFHNVSGGTGVYIEGGYDLYEIGHPILPFVVHRIPLGPGTGATSVDVRMTGEWTYYRSLWMPLYTGPQYDGAGAISRVMTEGDPDDGFYPVWTSDWSVVAGTDGNDLLVRIYPFEYDMHSFQGRFCPTWTITYVTDASSVGIGNVEKGEPEAGIVPFSFELTGGSDDEVSLTTWIAFDGEIVEELSSGTILINGTTSFEDVWDTAGFDPATYEFVIELRDIGGSVVGTYSLPLEVGTLMATAPMISLDPEEFESGTIVNVTVHFPNPNILNTLEGRFEISMLSNLSAPISELNGTIMIPPRGNVSRFAEFDMTGLTSDRYAVKASIIGDGFQTSGIAWLVRNGTGPEIPIEHYLVLDFALNTTEINEGGSFWINGTVLREDTFSIPGLPVAAWIGDREWSNSTFTGADGSFSMQLENVSVGNWTGAIISGDGGMSVEDIFEIRVLALPKKNETNNGNNTNGNNTNGNNTNGNNTNGNNTHNGNETGDDDDGKGWDADGILVVLLIAAASIIVVLILLVIVLVFAMMVRTKRKDRGTIGSEE